MGCTAVRGCFSAPAKPDEDTTRPPGRAAGPEQLANPALANPVGVGCQRGSRGSGPKRGSGTDRGAGRVEVPETLQEVFQVELMGVYQDYGAKEDAILKRAFLIGQPNARCRIRGQDYEYSFERFTQVNLGSGRRRRIRPPVGWSAPETPILPPGPATVLVVPDDAGSSVEIKDPNNPGARITVMLPETKRPGMEVAVPVPRMGETVQEAAKRQLEHKGIAKVAVAGASTSAGGLAVTGVVLGEHLSDALPDSAMADGADSHGATSGDAAEFVMEVF